jgi:hypothetical protein
MGASVCWVVAETDTPFTIFDLSALKKQLLIFNERRFRVLLVGAKNTQASDMDYFSRLPNPEADEQPG